MRFIVSSSYLFKKLQTIGGVINSNNTMPILDNFLFELSKNKLVVSASDLETTIKGVIEVESDSEGSIAVPYKFLVDTLKMLPEQAITFIVNDNKTAQIRTNNAEYSFAYYDAAEFPSIVDIPDPNKVSIMGDVLATAIQTTIFATGNDDLRPIMNGVFFDFSENGLTFAATDAHKLVKYERKDIDGVYKTGAVTVLYKVYKADGTYKNYHNAAPDDPATFEGDEGKFELKDGKIFNISKNANPGDPVFSFKIEVNGNTMIQTKADDSVRWTFTKQ